MSRRCIGKLKPRYSFVLNPYVDVRLSKCPRCERPTHSRKFALFIHVDGHGPLIMGKTCRYCTSCELIIVHRDELEAELADSPIKFASITPGSGYLVLGTVEKKTWRDSLEGNGATLDVIRAKMADFKEHLHLHVQPGGWIPADE